MDRTRGTGAVALLRYGLSASLALLIASSTAAEPVSRSTTEFVVSEATNMSVALSGDGRWLAFDLQGMLWTMPIQGGAATRVTDASLESRYPHWSPDSRSLVFQCYREGNWQICITDRNGRNQQLTFDANDHREPTFSSDGRRLIFAADTGGNFDLWEMELDSRATRRLANTESEEAYPIWSKAGDRLAYVQMDQGGQRLIVRAADGMQNVLVQVAGSRNMILPSWSPDGDSLAYVEYDAGASTSAVMQVDLQTASVRRLSGENEDVAGSRVNWLPRPSTILYVADGEIRSRNLDNGKLGRIPFESTFQMERHRYSHRRLTTPEREERPVLGILRPHVSPDGKTVAFAALSDLWLLRVGTPQPQRLTTDSAVEIDPVFFPDGQRVVFGSDQRESGTMDLCVLDVRTGERRILASPGESVSFPSVSPDGRLVAFLASNSKDWHDRFVYILDASAGTLRKSPQPLFHPSRPSWSPGSRTIALGSMRAASARSRKGSNELLLINVADLSSRFVNLVTEGSLGSRAANGPEWSPDGTHMAFVSDGLLWSAPVSKNGDLVGKPVRLTNGLADSISWTGDGKRIVFLSNGKLQEVDVNSGELTAIPLALSWRQAQPTRRTVVRAGRLFDPATLAYRHDVDIVIDGRRISAVQARGNKWPADVQLIDASERTVIPGLIESHIHNFPVNGEATGRLLLSFGVTSIREVGADPYDGLESRESWASGARPGPREFYSGLLEGGRVYYPMSLAIASVANLTLELERVAELDYDLVKTYEQLPDAQLARVTDFAHAHGLTVTSHELWPAAGFGVDSVEHLATRDRLGYSDRQSFGGEIRRDVVEILRRSGMFITSTAFAYQAGAERPPDTEGWRASNLTQMRNLLPERYRQVLDSADAATSTQQAGQRARSAVSVRLIGKLHRAGINVIPATDSSFHLAGLSLIREMISIHNAGTPMGEVLRDATRGAATLLGVEADLGSVEAGKLADLVIVDGDPLKIPSDLLNVSVVVKDGVAYTQGDLARRDH